MFKKLSEQLKANPRTIVFTEGTDARILEAADKLTAEGVLGVILLGKADEVKAAAKETVKETKKEAAKTVETVKKAAGETKAAAKKVEAEVKATAKSVEAEVKTAVKKTASKAAAKTTKTAAKAVKEAKAKKPAVRKTTKAAKNTFDKELFFQYANKQVDEETLVARIVEDAKEQNVEIKELKMYLKPEDNACYYVANGNVAGRVNLY